VEKFLIGWFEIEEPTRGKTHLNACAIIGCTVVRDKWAANDSLEFAPFHGGESPCPSPWSQRC